ncbi:MAG: MFS transporter [Promethearchaeota archaeon]|nr:MAG: MFS transporter [Candidatus Lokiarchaeota archaeon]
MVQIIFWNSFGFMFYGFIVPYATSEYFEVSASIIGLVIASQPIGRLLITPLVGYLTDKVSKKWLVMIGSFGRTVSYTIMYLSIGFNSVIGFGLGIFIQGILVGFFWPPFNALVAEKSSKFFRSEAYGKRFGMMGWGSLVGAIISFSLFFSGIYWYESNVWYQYSSLIIYALINVFAGIRFMKKVDEKIKFVEDAQLPPDEPKSDSRYEIYKRSKNLIILGFIFLSLTVIFSSMNEHITRPFLQVFMYDILNLSTIKVMIILYVAGIIALIAAPKLGVYADKVGVIGFIIVSFLGAIVTWILISTTIQWLFISLLLVDLILATGGQLIAQSLFSRISVSHRGKVFGLMEWMNLLGWVIGPLLGGLLWDNFNPKTPFIFSIILELSLIPFFLLSLRYLKQQMVEKVK